MKNRNHPLSMPESHFNAYCEFEKSQLNGNVDSRPSSSSEDQRSFKDLIDREGENIAFHISGHLTDWAPWYWSCFGYEYTLYSEISEFMAYAEKEGIVEVDLIFNSQGGDCCNEFLTACDDIFNSKIKVNAIVDQLCASAAYGLASQADEITAIGEWSNVGSIGVRSGIYHLDDKNFKIVTNTDSQLKVLNADNEEHVKALVSQLDDFYNTFKARIDRKRKISDHGAGQVFTTEKAIAMNLIDGYYKHEDEEYIMPSKNEELTEKEGLESELKKSDSDAERLKAHYELAKVSGNYQFAIECAINGVDPTHALTEHIEYAKKTSAENSKKSNDSVSDLLIASVEEKEETEDLGDHFNEAEETEKEETGSKDACSFDDAAKLMMEVI